MQHIILIGFKNAGKSAIGQALAQELKRPFVDLDDKIREAHQAQTGESLSCRGIMEKHGEDHFRKLEHEVLGQVIVAHEPMVLAVGGGTPMNEKNRNLLSGHLVIRISAPKSVVFERIMINGKPAFFPKNEEAFESFQKLWNEREPVFKKLADITVENTGSIQMAVSELRKKLEEKMKIS